MGLRLQRQNLINFIDINLNNKANWKAGGKPVDSDIQAFMDLMSVGDNERLVELMLRNSEISASTRKAAEVFSTIMKNKIQKMSIDSSKYTQHLDKVLRKDEYNMTTLDLAVREGEKRGMIEGEKRGMIEGLIEGEKRGMIEGKKRGMIEGEKMGMIEGEKRGMVKICYSEFKLSPHDIANRLKIKEVEVIRILKELKLMTPPIE